MEENYAKILIIDDSPEAIKVLGNTLPKHYKKQVSLSGEKALKLLAAEEDLPDLILLDVMMPEMNGYDVCRHLKADQRLKEIPVIFLSGRTEVQDKVEAFTQGGVDYITKPFEAEEVRVRVSTHLRMHFMKKELERYNRKLEELVQEKIKEISELQLATIYALVKLADHRDDELGSHLERTQTLCRRIAQKLMESSPYRKVITNDFIENLVKASPLHDIGKVGLPDNVYLKPGKLTDEEFEVIKKHPIIGAETLVTVKEKYPGNAFINVGIEIARSHHEKWNGKGYPDGLKGEEIPLSARIMAIADVYDALRTKRPYKEPFSFDECHKIILEGRGTHFDPDIVDAFLAIEGEIIACYINNLFQTS